MHRTALLTGALGLVLAGLLGPAHAAPPAPFSKTVTFVDRTPDPSGYVLGPEHCTGKLPAEKPVAVNIPAAGVVAIDIRGFTGEWSLMVTNPKGSVIGTADADAPATESMKLKMKRAGTLHILPCNLAGSFEATLTYAYTPKK